MYFFGKSSPTPPTSFTGEKKLAATAAWLAEPPSRRGFSAFGVLMESSAVVPIIKTLMEISVTAFAFLNQFDFIAFRRVNECESCAAGTGRRAVGVFQSEFRKMFCKFFETVHFKRKMCQIRLHLN